MEMRQVLSMPTVGEGWEDGIAVAWGHMDDVFVGVLYVRPDQPGEHYAVAEYVWEHGRFTEVWSQVFDNIVPAASYFHEQFGFWGGA